MNKVLKGFMAFLLIPAVTPIYNILDRWIFVKVFGCGCVPDVQNNIFNSTFNANDLRLVVYSILTISMVILATIISRAFTKKFLSILYVSMVLGVNTSLSIFICRSMMWG